MLHLKVLNKDLYSVTTAYKERYAYNDNFWKKVGKYFEKNYVKKVYEYFIFPLLKLYFFQTVMLGKCGFEMKNGSSYTDPSDETIIT